MTHVVRTWSLNQKDAHEILLAHCEQAEQTDTAGSWTDFHHRKLMTLPRDVLP